MHNLLFGLMLHFVVILSSESRKIGLATSHSERNTEALSTRSLRQSGQAQKKQELLGQDTVRLNEAEYKLQSLVSPEFHESSKYFHKPFKQVGDLQMDTLSPAQVNFVQTSSLWPQYAEPKENHQGTIYPENPVPFPISKNTAEDEDHAKQWWDPNVADSFSRADLGSPQKSYERDSQGDNKSWWGSDKDYSYTPNDPSSNYQSYPIGEDSSNIPKFADNRASQMMGNTQENQENIPQMFQGNMISSTGHHDGSLKGQNLLGKGGQQNFASPADAKPGLFGDQFSPLFGSSNSLTNEGHLWSSQVNDEKQGILQGLQEAASMITGEEKGQGLSTTPTFGDEDTKASARSLHGINKMHAFHAKRHKPHETKNDKSATRKDEGHKRKAGRSKGNQTSKLRKLSKRFLKLFDGHMNTH